MVYEKPGQQTPSLEAKGIELVRRDNCLAVCKIMEGALRRLFGTGGRRTGSSDSISSGGRDGSKYSGVSDMCGYGYGSKQQAKSEGMDLSAVKEYLHRQWTKILLNKVSTADFVFAKEVKLGTYAHGGSLPPAAVVASRAMQTDHVTEPLYGQRVRYVVVSSTV
jgi:DNA polymerase zeta